MESLLLLSGPSIETQLSSPWTIFQPSSRS
jgi:hypothetical protein